jgi:hypothetical protein
MLRHSILLACFAGSVAAVLSVTACPPSTGTTGEGEGEGAAGEGEGEGAGEGEGVGGEGEGEGANPCAGIPAEGKCTDANTLEICGVDAQGNPAPQSIACNTLTGVTGGTCNPSVNVGWGPDCTETGGTCNVPDATGQLIAEQIFCTTDPTDVCVQTSTGSSCQTSTTQGCTLADDDKCVGTTYQRCWFLAPGDTTDKGQFLKMDCADLGGTCTPGGLDAQGNSQDILGGCYQAPNQHCTPFVSFCGTGPNDANRTGCPASGTCPPPGGEGEGEGEGEGAAGEGEGEGGQ